MIVVTTTDKRVAWAQKITTAFNKGVLGIIQIGADLAQARKELTPKDFWEMVENDLPFGKRTAERYLAIAECKWIATRVSHLPPAMSTLYAIAQLPDALRETSLKAGTINPNMEREDVAAIKQGAGIGPKPKPKAPPQEAVWTETPAPRLSPREATSAPKASPPKWDALNAAERVLSDVLHSVEGVDVDEIGGAENPGAGAKIKAHIARIREALTKIEAAVK